MVTPATIVAASTMQTSAAGWSRPVSNKYMVHGEPFTSPLFIELPLDSYLNIR